MLIKKEVSSVIDEHMMSYAAEVLLHRAIPILQDGFKPVNRRILFTFYNNNITQLTKSMTVTGRIAEIHPHGSTYGAMVNMAQEDRNTVPLLTGHGNFGQFNTNLVQEAAERYTEIKISEFGKEMTKSIKDKVTSFSPNYDGRIQVPDIIPVSFPTILLYAQSGIGVGYASSTLSYNMNEIANAIGQYAKNGTIPMIYPDFTTKGFIIEDNENLKSNNINGKASFTLRGKIEKVNNYTLQITEMPYGVKRENIVDKIVQLYKKGTLSEIRNVQDLSDFKGELIEITTKKSGVDLDVLIAKLYKLTPLETSISSNPNVIDYNKGLPEVLGVSEIIERWINWRIGIVRIGLQHKIEKLEKTVSLYSGLGKVKNKIDELINVIRGSKKNELLNNVKKEFDLNEEQANYVINIKLFNINEGFLQDRIDEINELKNQLKDMKKLEGDDELIKQSIADEVNEISKKYGYERQTKIVKKSKPSTRLVKKVEKELTNKVDITITQRGYVFKNGKNIKLLQGDEVVRVIKNIDENKKLQVISNDGNIYGIEISQIPENVNNIGTYALSLSKLDVDGISMFILSEEDEELLYGYSNGKINKWSPSNTLNFNKSITRNAFAKDDIPTYINLNTHGNIIVSYNNVNKKIKMDDIKINGYRGAKGTYSTSNHKDEHSFVTEL